MDKQLIARWKSQRGKDWVELWHDEYGYYYRGNTCWGSLGNATLEQAMTFMNRETATGMQVFCSQSSPMKREEL